MNKQQIDYNKLYIMLFKKLLYDKKGLCLLAKKMQSKIEYKIFINNGLIIDIKEVELIELYNKNNNFFYLYFADDKTKNEKISYLQTTIKNYITELYKLNLRLLKN